MTLKVIARASVDPPAKVPTQSISAESMKRLAKKQAAQSGNTKAKNFNAAAAHTAIEADLNMIQRNTVNSYGFGGITRPADPATPKQNQQTAIVREFLHQRYGDEQPGKGDGNQGLYYGELDTVEKRQSAAQAADHFMASHIEKGPWYKNKGALYLFHGTEGPGTNEPYMAMYFQRYPTEISYSRSSNIAEQNIAGQTGTSLQNLGSTSTKISTELFFHDAWIEKEQVTTQQGLTQLDAIIKLGWQYKLFFQVGTNAPIPVVLNSLKVVMSHFTASGLVSDDNRPQFHKENSGQSYRFLQEKMRDVAADVPQHARVTVEMTVDESKDVVVPFVKRAPVRRPNKKPASRICLSPEQIQGLKQTAITEGLASGLLYSADVGPQPEVHYPQPEPLDGTEPNASSE